MSITIDAAQFLRVCKKLNTLINLDHPQDQKKLSEIQESLSRAFGYRNFDSALTTLKSSKNASEILEKKLDPLAELGFSEDHCKMISRMLESPIGAIIVAGIAGSGRSRTLQKMICNLTETSHGMRIYSIEDHPEYILKGVTQIPVRRRESSECVDDSPYANTMRYVLGMDPQIIMIDELRDKNSVELFTDIVKSGVKVLTTLQLHASSTMGIWDQLKKLGLANTTTLEQNNKLISGIIFQHLVPALCSHCKIKYDPLDLYVFPGDDGIKNRIARVLHDGSTIFVKGKGCSCCIGGYIGRTVCAEVVSSTNIMEPASDRLTAMDHAMSKMHSGLISPVDVESAFGYITTDPKVSLK